MVESKGLSYGDYLQLDKILNAQTCQSEINGKTKKKVKYSVSCIGVRYKHIESIISDIFIINNF